MLLDAPDLSEAHAHARALFIFSIIYLFHMIRIPVMYFSAQIRFSSFYYFLGRFYVVILSILIIIIYFTRKQILFELRV